MKRKEKILKTITVIVLIGGLIIEIPLLIYALSDAIEYRSLKGGGRAQAEFFLMPMFFIGGPIAILALIITLINAVVDGLRKTRISKRTLIIYLGLGLLILIPTLGSWLLLQVMYSGWK